MTADHVPPPLTHKSRSLLDSLWLDQSFDLCCQVTFPDPTGPHRVGTHAGAHGIYLSSSDAVGGCHRALVFLMSPLTPASVVAAGEIWHPRHAVNNRINPPVFIQRRHLWSLWWNVPMLIFGGVLPVCFRVQSELPDASHGGELSTRWLSWQCPELPGGPADWSEDSWMLQDDKGQLEESRTLLCVSRHNGPQPTVRDTKWCSVSLHHLFNHQSPINLPQVCCCFSPDFMYLWFFSTVSAYFKHVALFVISCFSFTLKSVFAYMFTFHRINALLLLNDCSQLAQIFLLW